MLIFNYLKDRNERGKLARFYHNYPNLNWLQKILWHLAFVNWIPMVLAVANLLAAGIAWNFTECPGWFWSALVIVGVVFLPWITIGFINSIKELK